MSNPEWDVSHVIFFISGGLTAAYEHTKMQLILFVLMFTHGVSTG